MTRSKESRAQSVGPHARKGPLAERRKRSSRTLAMILFAFAALIFLITLTRLGANVAERSL